MIRPVIRAETESHCAGPGKQCRMVRGVHATSLEASGPLRARLGGWLAGIRGVNLRCCRRSLYGAQSRPHVINRRLHLDARLMLRVQLLINRGQLVGQMAESIRLFPAVRLTGANRNESLQAPALVDAIPTWRRGRRRRPPDGPSIAIRSVASIRGPIVMPVHGT
jgi:hypothetical protein